MGPADFLWRFQVFFDVLADTSMHEELAIRELAHCLDRLIVFHHFYDAMPDPGSVEDAVIPFDDAAVQALVRARFPSLGLYNIPRAIVTDIGTTSLGVCRAHDDLLAIAHGLGAIRWYGERGDFDTATWYYLFGMQSDLGNRIHNLRWYLHARVNER